MRIASLDPHEEWFVDITDPQKLITQARKANADLVTFCQRLPDLSPEHDYPGVFDAIAALPIKSYDEWFNTQMDRRARNKVRKAVKQGLEIRQATFNYEFIDGMVAIFNETPIRQGRPFLHYGKDRETVRREFSKFLFREEIWGAYFGNELIGFIFLADGGRYAYLGQIISKIARRDLATNNALLAKAVERCAAKRLPYLVYALWLDDSLGQFKQANGFVKYNVPRYYVPLTAVGWIAQRCRYFYGWRGIIPERLRPLLKQLRTRWYLFGGKQ